MNIDIYDCPTWDTKNIIRGKFVTQMNYVDESVLLCDFIEVLGGLHVIYRKVYNHSKGVFEIWVKGKFEN